MCVSKRILILEAFYGGSHKDLIEYINDILSDNGEDVAVDLITMSDKKWHWRLRTSALYFAENIPGDVKYTCIFVTSVLNFAELLGLRPDLNCAHKILYFHENQLVYPVRKQQDRDFQYGYNQILSCLSADKVLFNSNYNMNSFLERVNSYYNVMPDYRPKGLKEKIIAKCEVLYYALSLAAHVPTTRVEENTMPLHIVWAHRWEHDKNPDEFFNVLFKLADGGFSFKISVLGQSFTDNPIVFSTAKEKLKDNILNWGYLESKDDYINVLKEADVAVSTANHEFFGVSMLEAVSYGCYPLCPNRLVYPEFFPKTYLYNTIQQLLKKIRNFSKNLNLVRNHEITVDFMKFDGKHLRSKYLEHLLK